MCLCKVTVAFPANLHPDFLEKHPWKLYEWLRLLRMIQWIKPRESFGTDGWECVESDQCFGRPSTCRTPENAECMRSAIKVNWWLTVRELEDLGNSVGSSENIQLFWISELAVCKSLLHSIVGLLHKKKEEEKKTPWMRLRRIWWSSLWQTWKGCLGEVCDVTKEVLWRKLKDAIGTYLVVLNRYT